MNTTIPAAPPAAADGAAARGNGDGALRGMDTGPFLRQEGRAPLTAAAADGPDRHAGRLSGGLGPQWARGSMPMAQIPRSAGRHLPVWMGFLLRRMRAPH